MSRAITSDTKLPETSLGAGDLIDRAVRFYRLNFWTFLWIVSPPIIIGTLISIIWSFLAGELTGKPDPYNPSENLLSVMLTGFGNLLIWFIETIFILSVMGGASRNFVRHILFGEPITLRETYTNFRARPLGLLTASTIITLILGISGFFVFYFSAIIAMLVIFLIAAAFSFSPFIAFILSLIAGSASVFAGGWLFFLLASRFAYVPQIMLVEGQGVFEAISRSATLASGNVKRLAALFVFTILATYSALALFYVPLGWYAYANGLEIFSSNPDVLPVWFKVASQVVSQLSLILLMPVWMIGLCLLYVDERVRHEGYDIELLAARSLGEIPAVPQTHTNPLHPALAATQIRASEKPKDSPFTTLGLNG